MNKFDRFDFTSDCDGSLSSWSAYGDEGATYRVDSICWIAGTTRPESWNEWLETDRANAYRLQFDDGSVLTVKCLKRVS
jgi:hypothetical protein